MQLHISTGSVENAVARSMTTDKNENEKSKNRQTHEWVDATAMVSLWHEKRPKRIDNDEDEKQFIFLKVKNWKKRMEIWAS